MPLPKSGDMAWMCVECIEAWIDVGVIGGMAFHKRRHGSLRLRSQIDLFLTRSMMVCCPNDEAQGALLSWP